MLVSVEKAGNGAPASSGEESGHQGLNNKGVEDVAKSKSNLCPGKPMSVLKTTSVSFRDKRRKMEWPRRRTLLGEEGRHKQALAAIEFSCWLTLKIEEEFELKEGSPLQLAHGNVK